MLESCQLEPRTALEACSGGGSSRYDAAPAKPSQARARCSAWDQFLAGFKALTEVVVLGALSRGISEEVLISS